MTDATMTDQTTARPAPAKTSTQPATVKREPARTVTAVHGPAEQAIAGLLRDRLPGSFGDSLDLDAPAIEMCRRSRVGDFRIDLRPLTREESPPRDLCQAVAARLTELPEIDQATLVFPRIYLRTSIGFLFDAVTEAVRREGHRYGMNPDGEGREVEVTFSDPNANKPLHVGHLRNNFLGMALSNLLEARGWNVRRTQLLSDFGIHICHAVLGYLKWGDDQIPESTGERSDYFVGRHYVRFHKEVERQRQETAGAGDNADGSSEAGVGNGSNNTEDGERFTALEREAADLLTRMESGDEELIALNRRITRWAMEGMAQTYRRIGTRLERVYRESEHLRDGAALIAEGLASGAYQRRPDGSVFVDLDGMAMSTMTLLRGNGTQTVYTRAFGLIAERNRLSPNARVIDVLGRDWEIAYPAFLAALGCLSGREWTDHVELIFHGMVRRPTGRMRSRKGDVVGADDLIDQVRDLLAERASSTAATAIPADRAATPEGGSPSPEDLATLDKLAVALVKYELMRPGRMKEIVFDETRIWKTVYPAVTRVLATLRQAAAATDDLTDPRTTASRGEPHESWRPLLLCIDEIPALVEQAARALDPAPLVRHLDEFCVLSLSRPGVHELSPLMRTLTATVAENLLSILNIEEPDPHRCLKLLG